MRTIGLSRLLACAIAVVLMVALAALTVADEPQSDAGFSHFYNIGTDAYQLVFFYFFIAFPVSMWVDHILRGRRPTRTALMILRLIGHTISGFAVGWLLSFPLSVLPESRLNFAASCSLLMLLMFAVDRLLHIRIKRKRPQP